MGGDGPGTASAILEQLDRAGRTIREWDPYRQPIGIHYSPHALNRTHQDKEWLDFVLYLPEGGPVAILSPDVPRAYRVFDPLTGEVLSEGRLADTQSAQAMSGPGSVPRVLVFHAK